MKIEEKEYLSKLWESRQNLSAKIKLNQESLEKFRTRLENRDQLKLVLLEEFGDYKNQDLVSLEVWKSKTAEIAKLDIELDALKTKMAELLAAETILEMNYQNAEREYNEICDRIERRTARIYEFRPGVSDKGPASQL